MQSKDWEEPVSDETMSSVRTCSIAKCTRQSKERVIFSNTYNEKEQISFEK